MEKNKIIKFQSVILLLSFFTSFHASSFYFIEASLEKLSNYPSALYGFYASGLEILGPSQSVYGPILWVFICVCGFFGGGGGVNSVIFIRELIIFWFCFHVQVLFLNNYFKLEIAKNNKNPHRFISKKWLKIKIQMIKCTNRSKQWVFIYLLRKRNVALLSTAHTDVRLIYSFIYFLFFFTSRYP